MLDRMIKDEYESKGYLTPKWWVLCAWKDCVSEKILSSMTRFHKFKSKIYKIQAKHRHNLMIQTLIEYVLKYAQRGEYQCGKRNDRVEHPEQHQPTGHTADLFYFKVALKQAADGTSADKETLQKLIEQSSHGSMADCTPLDGKEHSFIELGAWIGDQGLAFMFMGMCDLLGLGKVMTPNMLPIPQELKDQMAGMGMISLISNPPPVTYEAPTPTHVSDDETPKDVPAPEGKDSSE